MTSANRKAQQKMQSALESANSMKILDAGRCSLTRKALEQNKCRAALKDNEVSSLILRNSNERYMILSYVTFDPDVQWKFVVPLASLQGNDQKDHSESVPNENMDTFILVCPASTSSPQNDAQRAQKNRLDRACSAKSLTNRILGSNALGPSQNRGLVNRRGKVVKDSGSPSQQNSSVSSSCSNLLHDNSDAAGIDDLLKDQALENSIKSSSKKKAKKKGKCKKASKLSSTKVLYEEHVPEIETSEAIVRSVPQNWGSEDFVSISSNEAGAAVSMIKGEVSDILRNQDDYSKHISSEGFSGERDGLKLDSSSKYLNSEFSTSTGSEIEEKPTVKEDGGLYLAEPNNSCTWLHEPGKEYPSHGFYCIGGVDINNLAERTQCSTLDSASSESDLFEPVKRRRRGRKSSGNSSSMNRFSNGGFAHGHIGKENNGSVCQKVCPYNACPVGSHNEIASKELHVSERKKKQSSVGSTTKGSNATKTNSKRVAGVIKQHEVLEVTSQAYHCNALTRSNSHRCNDYSRVVLSQTSRVGVTPLESAKASHVCVDEMNLIGNPCTKPSDMIDQVAKSKSRLSVPAESVSDLWSLRNTTEELKWNSSLIAPEASHSSGMSTEDTCVSEENSNAIAVHISSAKASHVCGDEMNLTGNPCSKRSDMIDRVAKSKSLLSAPAESVSYLWSLRNISEGLKWNSSLIAPEASRSNGTSTEDACVSEENSNASAVHISSAKASHVCVDEMNLIENLCTKPSDMIDQVAKSKSLLSVSAESVSDLWSLKNTAEEHKWTSSLIVPKASRSSCMNTEDACVSEENRNDIAVHISSESKNDAVSKFCCGSNEMVNAVKEAYRTQLVAEGVQMATGTPLADFERLLYCASPVIDDTCSLQQCQSCPRDQIIGNSLCVHERQNISLGNIWEWYEYPGNFGLEVISEDYGKSRSMGIRHCECSAYFVPFVSAVQLLGSPTINATSTGIVSSAGQNMTNASDNVSSHSHGKVSMDDPQILYEYYESEPPQRRHPFFQQIQELVKGKVPLNGLVYGDPTNLGSLYLHDLHPASWYCVAWYPIYKIPEGLFRAAFLTYHSLGHIIRRRTSSHYFGGDTSIVAPVIGLQSYNAQDESWFQLRHSVMSHTEETSGSNVSKILKERLQTLELTASVMARGIVRKGSQRSVNRQPDYEFFQARHRFRSFT